MPRHCNCSIHGLDMDDFDSKASACMPAPRHMRLPSQGYPIEGHLGFFRF